MRRTKTWALVGLLSCLASVAYLLTGCTTTIGGKPTPGPVIGTPFHEWADVTATVDAWVVVGHPFGARCATEQETIDVRFVGGAILQSCAPDGWAEGCYSPSVHAILVPARLAGDELTAAIVHHTLHWLRLCEHGEPVTTDHAELGIPCVWGAACVEGRAFKP